MFVKILVQSLVVVGLMQSGLCIFAGKALSAEIPSTSMLAQSTEGLTANNIQQVLDALAVAREQEDVEAMLQRLAPFTTSVVTVERDDVSTTLTLDGIEDHRAFLVHTYEKSENRETLAEQVFIDVVNDQLAIVRDYRFRNFETPDDGSFFMSSETIMRFGWVNGKPMITSMTIDGWIAQRPEL
jgi:hypothetical protein